MKKHAQWLNDGPFVSIHLNSSFTKHSNAPKGIGHFFLGSEHEGKKHQVMVILPSGKLT